ncbi:peptidylprolyl isomerase [Acidobacteriota bacterium]
MKIKVILLILVISVVLVCFHCKNDTPRDTAVEKEEAKAAAAAAIGEKIVLQINKKKFSNNDFKNFLELQYPDISSSGGNPSPNPSQHLISRLFDSFVQHKTILYIADQYDIPIDETELQEYIEKLNVSKDSIDMASVIDAIKVQKYLYASVYDSIDVSEKEIRAYYNQHLEQFRKKPEVLLYQILLKDKETALRVRGILDNNPQKFEELAKKESISMEAKEGGRMGFFEEGTLPKDMEQVVFSLSTHTISPVVESAYGFHIFKITNKKRGRLLYLDKVKPEIKQILMSEKLRNAYDDYLAKAARDLDITIKYNDLYFDYQNIEGDTRDENKETINTDSPNNSTD